VSVSEPHTSMFNVKFCLYGMYIGPYVASGTAGSAGHLYCTLLLPPTCPYGPVPFCPIVGPHLSDADRWRRKDSCWGSDVATSLMLTSCKSISAYLLSRIFTSSCKSDIAYIFSFLSVTWNIDFLLFACSILILYIHYIQQIIMLERHFLVSWNALSLCQIMHYNNNFAGLSVHTLDPLHHNWTPAATTCLTQPQTHTHMHSSRSVSY